MTDDSQAHPRLRADTAATTSPTAISDERYRALFDDAADAMLILDDDRRISDANRAAGALLGTSPDDLVGQSFDDFFRADREQLDTCWRELLAFGEAKREHRLQTGRLGTRLVECSYRAAAQSRHHVCIARDITDRRLLEERLVQSERIESIGRLAGGIAHDFNNLLTTILGYAELLLNQRGPRDPDRTDLEEIQKAGQRAAALTQRLLAYSRKQVLIPKEVDLNVAVVNLRSLLSRVIRADIQLTCATCPTPALVTIDPTQLEHVVTNLVLNSRDALPGGGHIRLDVARVRLSQVEVPIDQPTRAADYVRLSVSDDGIGIPLEAQSHLFEPFFTTKETGKGTGLGLASVYGIVRQSNGFITVDSAPGRGATFTMHFPAVGSTMEETGTAAPTTDAGRETILLVEDEESVRSLIGAVLRRQGYRVLDAADAVEARALFATHNRTVDLLLTDVVMPGMNGPALAQHLVGCRSDLRVLFISGYSYGGSPLDDGNPNAGFLSKPFSASVLVSKVREMLGSSAAVRYNHPTADDTCPQLRAPSQECSPGEGAAASFGSRIQALDGTADWAQ